MPRTPNANITDTEAAVDPTVSDDDTQGYDVGSRWINTVTHAIFFAIDVSTGAAVWKDITSVGLSHTGIVTPAVIGANQDDYSPAGLSTASVLRLDASTPGFTITGLDGGSSGRAIILQNVGTFPITLTHEDNDSIAVNRFTLTKLIVMPPATSVALQYDGTTLRWRSVGGTTFGGLRASTLTYTPEFDNGNSGAAPNIDWSAGQKQTITLDSGSVTFTFTAPLGPANFVLRIVQDVVGGRVAFWPASVKWPGGVTMPLSQGASAVDIVSFYYDGTNYYAITSRNFL